MSATDFKAQLKRQLPDLLRQDAEMRVLILQTVENYFANRQETESRFDRVLAQMERDREEQARQWYEKRHQRSATRKIVISPMVHPTAQPIASRLGMELYKLCR